MLKEVAGCREAFVLKEWCVVKGGEGECVCVLKEQGGVCEEAMCVAEGEEVCM